jgi:hypothetical protein
MKRLRLATLLTVSALGVGSLIVAPTSSGASDSTPPPMTGQPGVTIVQPGQLPAGATPDSFGQCTIGLCFWQNADYSGSFWYYDQKTDPLNTWFETKSHGNEASSYYNDRVQSSYVSKNYPPSNQWRCISSQEASQNLSLDEWPDGNSMNDSINSVNLNSGNNC